MGLAYRTDLFRRHELPGRIGEFVSKEAPHLQLGARRGDPAVEVDAVRSY
jgi:hypothetical protein